MGLVAIACYRPKPGQEEALLAVLREHLSVLRAEGLVTDQAPYLMRAQDGAILEVFEWISEEAKDRAHRSETVGRLWQKFFDSAEFPPLAEIEEARRSFASFVSIA
jgi:quinol monooxygenase YgiN